MRAPDSKHFRLQLLTEGVYAAIHIDGGSAIGNAGIIDLGDRTVIFDTFATPQAAKDLRSVAETLTARPIDAVVNSHWHHDHNWGNQAFSVNTKIISTDETRRLLFATRKTVYGDAYLADAQANLEAVRKQFQETVEEHQRHQLVLWIDYYQSIVEAKPILQDRGPNYTFAKRVAFHGTDRSAELIAFRGGHSESDAVLYLPQEGIVFMGDLLCIEHHPWLVGGDPEIFCHALEVISDLTPELLVPGHGPVGKADSITTVRQYIHTLNGIAQKMVEEGKGVDKIDNLDISEAYKDWLFASFFSDNLRYLYQHQLGKHGMSLLE